MNRKEYKAQGLSSVELFLKIWKFTRLDLHDFKNTKDFW